jgi:hypothetical protein
MQIEDLKKIGLNEKEVLWMKENFNDAQVIEAIKPALLFFDKAGKETESETLQIIVIGMLLGLILKQSNMPKKVIKGLLEEMKNFKY